MEPELESEAGELNASQRRQLAAKLGRWKHQLEITAMILDRKDPVMPKRIKWVSPGKAVLN